jgi:hypothetical protein
VRWFFIIRTVVLFILGVVLVVDAVFGKYSIDRIIELTVGLVLLGVIPVDIMIDRIGRK